LSACEVVAFFDLTHVNMRCVSLTFHPSTTHQANKPRGHFRKSQEPRVLMLLGAPRTKREHGEQFEQLQVSQVHFADGLMNSPHGRYCESFWNVAKLGTSRAFLPTQNARFCIHLAQSMVCGLLTEKAWPDERRFHLKQRCF